MSKIKRYDGLPRVTKIPEGGTDGAILGVNLRDSSGRIIQPSEVLNATDEDGSRPTAATIWRLIREIPDNIQKVAALAGIGFTTRGSDGAWYQRILQQGTGITIQNGDGVAGDPAIALADLPNSGGGALVKFARDSKGRVSGTSSATTDDLTQGSTNKYFPEAPTDGYPYVRRSGTWEQTNSPSARYWLIEYPLLTDQAGNQLTDQAGNLLISNSPIIPTGWPAQNTTQSTASNVLPAMTLAQANALANPQDFQMVAIVDLTGGREPCWYDASVGSGTKWRRFSDRSIAS
ncbi:hypothetical protein NG831_06610 [Xanthomonas sacchari]|uniref:hypothetical protein n=1 Tax=Xanthomonas sacchari TaxID=56458 RepID=UPI002256C0A8|nr:hypothetical protein [Xanthomonas sacchari]MCW0413467.1 hypothetical protein [Xanthomonas sacchari]UYK67832.1 hypothetical protein NG831_06610 [Xanthomonas sacchari]